MQFIGEPYTKWKNAIKKFNDHITKGYHKFAIAAGDQFLDIAKGASQDIFTSLDNKKKKKKTGLLFFNSLTLLAFMVNMNCLFEET